MIDRRVIQFTLLAGFLGPGLAGAVHAENALDFSDVTSRSMAEELVKQGRLETIFLFPTELGGEDRPENITYVPVGVGEAQALIIGTLTHYMEDGLVDQMTVEPSYRGDSFIPTQIRYVARHSTKAGVFTPTLDIW
ncbi:MAG: hypothetical protein JWR84_2332 [Caulobacter sp.]|nr:hypothetical protein [Caulobacter sp.]